MPPPDKRELGRLAEDDALAYLLLQGLKLVERNFLCKGGELDLIMRDGKASSSSKCASAAAVLSAAPWPASRNLSSGA